MFNQTTYLVVESEFTEGFNLLDLNTEVFTVCSLYAKFHNRYLYVYSLPQLSVRFLLNLHAKGGRKEGIKE
jgi:hypothetical protein